jgi:hypothetical protein
MSFLRPKVNIPPPPPPPPPMEAGEEDTIRAAALAEEAVTGERRRRKGRGSTIVTGLTSGQQSGTTGRPGLTS